jgi:hypothetical protein
MWIIYVKLPKVNNCPLGENSPNLVTLPAVKKKNFFLHYKPSTYIG